MIERYMAIIRAEIEELQILLDEANMPEDKDNTIRDILNAMSQVVSRYE